jgi:cation transport regulator ChaC
MKLYSTKAHNQANSDITGDKPVWIFGYGSLIHKVDFPYLDRKEGHIHGWQRRFWMASQDHRGTPEKPGRVLTIHKVENEPCFGVAYLIEPEVLSDIDHREQNGYLRQNLDVTTQNGESLKAITYIGDPDAPVYQIENNNQKLAEQILKSTGPSGPNRDYLFHLADALRKHNENDAHIFDIEARVIRLLNYRG